jgi:SRSO17 transposase
MTGASIETTLELWGSSLRDVKARLRGLFAQERVAASAGLFLDGLLGDERRKTGWMRAEAAVDAGGMPMSCVTSCRIMSSKTSARRMRFWSSMRPAF